MAYSAPVLCQLTVAGLALRALAQVATAVCVEAQKLGIANLTLGASEDEVRSQLKSLMWSPYST